MYPQGQAAGEVSIRARGQPFDMARMRACALKAWERVEMPRTAWGWLLTQHGWIKRVGKWLLFPSRVDGVLERYPFTPAPNDR